MSIRLAIYCLVFAITPALLASCSLMGVDGNGNVVTLPTPITFKPLIPPPGNTPMIILKRGENAFGVGPVFTLSIFGDGRVEYEPGEDHPMPIYKPDKTIPRPTPSHRLISQIQLGEIILKASSIDLFSMRDRYVDTSDGCPHVVPDQASLTLTVNLQTGEKKTVLHYQGCLEDSSNISSISPKPLKEFEGMLLSLVQ